MNRLVGLLRCKRDSESGNTMILIAVLMSAIVGFSGLALDYGHAASEHRIAQNAADTVAQTAAYEIYAGVATEATATAMGNTALGKNRCTSCTLVGGAPNYLDSSGSATSTVSNVMYVQAKVTEAVPTYLLGILGISTMNVAGGATVKVGLGTGNCALCLLSPTKGLTTSGTTNFTVTNGNIWIDDALGGAITDSGTTNLTATQIGVVATAANGAVVSSGSPNFSPAPTLGAAVVPDPLANVPAPSVAGPSYGTVVESGSVNPTLNPGIYSGLILSGSGTVTFNPGIYIFTGGITISGSWDFVGAGVMLYFTCSSYSSGNTQPCNGSSGGGLTWSGTTTYQVSAPTSGAYKGLAIFYDRGNTAGITLSGSPTDSLSGTVYAKDSSGNLSGTFATNQVNSRIILSDMTISGSNTVNLNFDQSKNYGVPSLPVFTQ
jgi:hypothetical protein